MFFNIPMSSISRLAMRSGGAPRPYRRVVSEIKDYVTVIDGKSLSHEKLPHYTVTLESRNGHQVKFEAYGQEAAKLETQVQKQKSRYGGVGASPKIYINGRGGNGDRPIGAGCTNQKKSANLPDNTEGSKHP